jgi:hypothetical protein
VLVAVALTLALACVAPAQAGTSKPRSGTWAGRTSQGYTINFRVVYDSGKRFVTRVTYRYRYRCGDRTEGPFKGEISGYWQIDNARARARDLTGDVRIRFPSTRRASGTLRAWSPRGDRKMCDSGSVSWKSSWDSR